MDSPTTTPSLFVYVYTFGRLSSCDCRLLFETVSKLHARIVVQEVEPFQAILEVHGVNGLTHNGISYSKGCHIPLSPSDEIIICDRHFQWGSATHLSIKVDSPPPSQRRPPRQSLINQAQAVTPSRPTPSRRTSLFSGLLSPFLSAPSRSEEEEDGEVERIVGPSPVEEQDEGEGEGEQELMNWDEEAEEVGGDLISWDEVELEIVEEEEEEEVAPGTPEQKKVFSMVATPALADRARSLRPPTSLPRPSCSSSATPPSTGGRRRSMRMTIVPSSRVGEWMEERDSLRQAQQEEEKEEREQHCSPSVANQGSSTSRRISALLLSPGASFRSSGAEGEEDEGASSSDEEEDEEEVVVVAPPQPEAEQEQILVVASSVPLPDSPSPSTPQPMPRYNMARRHSLREKVLIRSAIKKAITPPLSPAVAPVEVEGRVEQAELGEGEVEMVDDFVEPELERDEEERVRPEDVPLPESPVTTAGTPYRATIGTPFMRPNTPRDSMDLLVRSPGRAETAAQVPDAEVEDESESEESEEESEGGEEEEEEEEVMMGSPTPAIRFAPTFKPATPVVQRAARVALPETPAGAAYSYTPKRPAPSTPGDMAQTMHSPIVELATPRLETSRPALQVPVTPRPAFKSEMTSPVTVHRLLPTPRSALRSPEKSLSRRKSVMGFLAPAPPSTKRKSVVWDELLYVREIVDIRDKGLHWDEGVDGVEERQKAAAVSVSTPTSSSTRKPHRVPNAHLAPSLTASLLKSISPFALPPVAFGTPSRGMGTPSRVGAAGPSPRKAGRVATPSTTAAATVGEAPVVASTPGSAKRRAGRVGGTPALKPVFDLAAAAQRQAEIKQLLATPPIPPVTSKAPATVVGNKSSSTATLVERMEALRRRSLPAFVVAPVVARPPTPISVTSVEQDEEEVIVLSPARAAPSPKATAAAPATPNLSAPLRRLFAPSRATVMATPRFAGLKRLMEVPKAAASPGVEGLEELLRTPEAVREVVQVDEEEEVDVQVEAEVEVEAPVEEQVQGAELEQQSVGEVPAFALEEEVVLEVPVVEEEVEAVAEEPLVEVAEEELVEVVEEQPVEAEVELPAEREEEEQAAPASAADAEVEEDQAPDPVETPAPRRGRPTKASTSKKSSSKKAIVSSQEEEKEDEHVKSTRPTRTTRKEQETPALSARRRAPAAKEEAQAESEEEREEATEVEPTPVVVKPTRGRTAKAKVEVEEKDEVAEVEASKPARRGRAAKVELVVDVVVAPARGRRAAVAKKAEVGVPEEASRESEPEAEAEIAQAPVKPAKKAAPARKSRATKAAAAPVVVLSDAEDEEEEESTTPAPAPARATRGKRAVVEQSSAEEVKATATRASRATKALSENTAPVAVAKPKRAAASKASKVVEEAPVATTTGRALRARR